MAGSAHPASLALEEIARLLQPLADAAASRPQPDGLLQFARDAGVRFEELLTELEPLTQVADEVATAFAPLRPVLDARAPPDLDEVHELSVAVRATFAALDTVDALPVPPDAEPILTQAIDRLVDHLVVTHLEWRHPLLYWTLRLVGVVHGDPRAEDAPGDPPLGDRDPDDPGPDVLQVRPQMLPTVLDDPAEALATTYGWGTPDADLYPLLVCLERVLHHVGALALFEEPPPEDAEALGTDHDEDEDDADRQLRIILLALAGDEGEQATFGLAMLPVPPDDGPDSAGLAVVPYGTGEVERQHELADGWRLRFRSHADAPSRYGVVARPGRVMLTGLDSETVPQTLRLDASLEGEPQSDEPRFVLGDPEGTRLEIGRAGLRVSAAIGESPELVMAVPLLGCRVVVDPSGRDGFLQAIMAQGVQARFDLVPAWSPSRGLHVAGGSGLAVTLPVREATEPVHIVAVHTALAPADEGVTATLTVTARTRIGPVMVTIDELGFGLQTAVRHDRGGHFGLLDVDFHLTPPAGVGVSVDAGPVSGGGHLVFDPDRQRYAGAVQLDVDGLALSAVGLLTTDVPGTRGYSLLVLVSGADFPPVNLGFGFTLEGIGGLLGIHRAADVDELRARVRSGGLDALAFPDDPLDGADELIDQLSSAFPPTVGRHLIGPAALIGWGTPTVLEMELVIALELPEPVRLVAVGQLRLRLPSAERAPIRLNMDAVGEVDIDGGRAALDATLYDSRVAAYAVEGDVALRARWSADPDLVLAAGGVNPRYPPPPDFPTLDRLSVRMERGGARLRLAAYLALTSNTVQMGARVDLEVAVGAFAIDGRLQFDTLVERSPFAFVADLTGGVRLRWRDHTLLGVRLEVTLSGPAPLYLRGQATFEIARFSHSVSFDVELDAGEPPRPDPPVDPLPELLRELEDPRSWSAPHRGVARVALADGTAAGVALVHPLGQLTVRQRVLPLEVEIARFGGVPLQDGPRTYTVDVTLQEGTPVEPRTVTDHFAPGQFLDRDRHDGLSAPAFERLPSGVRIEVPDVQFGGQHDAGLATSAPVGHDTRMVADGVVRSVPDTAIASDRDGPADVRGAMTRTRRDRYRRPDLSVRAREPVYVVARTDDLRVESFAASGGVDGLSHTAATQLLHRRRARGDAPDLHVIARHQAVGALPGLLPPGASPEEPGEYEERGSFGARVPGARRVTMLPDSDPLPPTRAPGRRWQWVAPLEGAE